jgi:metal-sulfur cluster biosynthetic enzyme
MSAHEEQVREALGHVYDPCSLAVNNPLSIVDMGLVRDVDLQPDGAVKITMCVTGAGCLMFPKFVDGAREQVQQLPFVTSVEIEMDASVLWTPELMTERGRRLQRGRHERSHRLAPVRPQQWREVVRR